MWGCLILGCFHRIAHIAVVKETGLGKGERDEGEVGCGTLGAMRIEWVWTHVCPHHQCGVGM